MKILIFNRPLFLLLLFPGDNLVEGVLDFYNVDPQILDDQTFFDRFKVLEILRSVLMLVKLPELLNLVPIILLLSLALDFSAHVRLDPAFHGLFPPHPAPAIPFLLAPALQILFPTFLLYQMV